MIRFSLKKKPPERMKLLLNYRINNFEYTTQNQHSLDFLNSHYDIVNNFCFYSGVEYTHNHMERRSKTRRWIYCTWTITWHPSMLWKYLTKAIRTWMIIIIVGKYTMFNGEGNISMLGIKTLGSNNVTNSFVSKIS